MKPDSSTFAWLNDWKMMDQNFGLTSTTLMIGCPTSTRPHPMQPCTKLPWTSKSRSKISHGPEQYPEAQWVREATRKSGSPTNPTCHLHLRNKLETKPQCQTHQTPQKSLFTLFPRHPLLNTHRPWHHLMKSGQWLSACHGCPQRSSNALTLLGPITSRCGGLRGHLQLGLLQPDEAAHLPPIWPVQIKVSYYVGPENV